MVSRRDSVHGEPDELALLDPQAKALQEGFNSFAQLRWVEAALERIVANPPPKNRFVQRHLIEELDALALNRLNTYGGRLRAGSMKIKKSRHKPPPPAQVSADLDDLCNYVNDHWDEYSPIHLASFVLWRVNWIHPFVDGNGRTARALAYYVLCAKLQRVRLPGSTTMPELIALDREPYYRALEAADRAFKRTNTVDVSVMEAYVELLYTEQMREAVAPTPVQNVNVIRHRRVQWMTRAGRARESDHLFAPNYEKELLAIAAIAGFLTLLFFMYFAIQPGAVPCDRRFPTIVVFAIGMALASGCFTGFAAAKGVLPIENSNENVLRFSLGGGAAILVICTFLGARYYLCDKPLVSIEAETGVAASSSSPH